MKKFFFGNQDAVHLTLIIAISVMMGLVIPLLDLEKFQEAGWSGIAWSAYWLWMIPFALFFLYKEHRERSQPK